MEMLQSQMLRYKNYNFAKNITSIEHIDSLETFIVRHSDVAIVSYPKSGSLWSQQIFSCIYELDEKFPNIPNSERIPFLEYFAKTDHARSPAPRLFSSHLTEAIMPPGFSNKKAKVVYIYRNPKDCAVSYYHYTKNFFPPSHPVSFGDFLELFLGGALAGGCWFEHVRDWYAKKDQYNILFITYEEMNRDLKAGVKKICEFLGKDLSESAIDSVVDKSSFASMKNNKEANFRKSVVKEVAGLEMRKGKVGDWKNTFTVAQSERIDEMVKQKLGDLPDLKIIWE